MTIRTVFAASAVLMAVAAATSPAATPAAATSATTTAFLAKARADLAFLDRSSRLALDKAAAPTVRTFALTEATEATRSADALAAWSRTSKTAAAVGALATDGGMLPLVGMPTGPLADVATGRSVAIDTPSVARPRPAGDDLPPAGRADLDRLASLRAEPFDAFYRASQADALRRLQTLYTTYLETGDDLALRDLAIRNLPTIRRWIATIRSL